ncbi:MAG TPA: zf-HC2 domain-containing protein [Actinomycetota bacterium]|jgi:hypothetical protein|nr:zf-HC2 domain-containing protein [Actinomycetota bacterium]
MSCLLVRDLLPEHAIGVLPRDEAGSVDRHLAWCAACRKEAGELQRAAATLAFSVAPVEPPKELEDRIADAVRGAAERRTATAPRRSRGVAAALLAAVLALTGLGWGAVMAGRNARLEEQVRSALKDRDLASRNFAEVLAELEGADPQNVIELADLMSPRQRIGGGDALVLLSPSSFDTALVVFTGLTGVSDRQLPIEVWLESDTAADMMVGEVGTLDPAGGGGLSEWYLKSLRPYDAIVVRDARGHVLLNGTLSVYEPTS